LRLSRKVRRERTEHRKGLGGTVLAQCPWRCARLSSKGRIVFLSACNMCRTSAHQIDTTVEIFQKHAEPQTPTRVSPRQVDLTPSLCSKRFSDSFLCRPPRALIRPASLESLAAASVSAVSSPLIAAAVAGQLAVSWRLLEASQIYMQPVVGAGQRP
jgi:hypothetical protein